ncbi:MAG: hypothetical protein A2X78_01380 [Gammaproteobacteria bacterium GWE2_37_16]|nr:MAG: hypothetical protein A2X78_01380 [Gammaproteobacteria bacterium GWE2_37_16]
MSMSKPIEPRNIVTAQSQSEHHFSIQNFPEKVLFNVLLKTVQLGYLKLSDIQNLSFVFPNIFGAKKIDFSQQADAASTNISITKFINKYGLVLARLNYLVNYLRNAPNTPYDPDHKKNSKDSIIKMKLAIQANYLMVFYLALRQIDTTRYPTWYSDPHPKTESETISELLFLPGLSINFESLRPYVSIGGGARIMLEILFNENVMLWEKLRWLNLGAQAHNFCAFQIYPDYPNFDFNFLATLLTNQRSRLESLVITIPSMADIADPEMSRFSSEIICRRSLYQFKTLAAALRNNTFLNYLHIRMSFKSREHHVDYFNELSMELSSFIKSNNNITTFVLSCNSSFPEDNKILTTCIDTALKENNNIQSYDIQRAGDNKFKITSILKPQNCRILRALVSTQSSVSEAVSLSSSGCSMFNSRGAQEHNLPPHRSATAQQEIDNLFASADGKLFPLAHLVEIHPEYKEDFYQRVITKDNFSKFIRDNIFALKKLIKTFPAHEAEINSLFSQPIPSTLPIDSASRQINPSNTF